MALAVASCSFSAVVKPIDWRWTAREHFKVLLSNETVACLLEMVWRSFDATISTPKLVLGHITNTGINIIALLRLGSTGEYLVFGFCIGPLCGRANTASLEPNILLYCPPMHSGLWQLTGMQCWNAVLWFPHYTIEGCFFLLSHALLETYWLIRDLLTNFLLSNALSETYWLIQNHPGMQTGTSSCNRTLISSKVIYTWGFIPTLL